MFPLYEQIFSRDSNFFTGWKIFTAWNLISWWLKLFTAWNIFTAIINFFMAWNFYGSHDFFMACSWHERIFPSHSKIFLTFTAWTVKIGIAWNLDKPPSLVKGHSLKPKIIPWTWSDLQKNPQIRYKNIDKLPKIPCCIFAAWRNHCFRVVCDSNET